MAFIAFVSVEFISFTFSLVAKFCKSLLLALVSKSLLSALLFNSVLVAKSSKLLKSALLFNSSFVANVSLSAVYVETSNLSFNSSFVAKVFKSLFKAYVDKLATRLLCSSKLTLVEISPFKVAISLSTLALEVSKAVTLFVKSASTAPLLNFSQVLLSLVFCFKI